MPRIKHDQHLGAGEFRCRCEPQELQVSSGKRTSMACSKMNLLIIVFLSTRCLPDQLSLSNSIYIYIFGDKTQCPGTLSNTLWSPVPRLDTPCPPPAQSNSSSRAALTWQMMAVSHQKSWWLRGLKQPVVEI